MNPAQPHQRPHGLSVLAKGQLHPPVTGECRQYVLNLVRGLDRPAVDLQDLGAIPQTAPKGVTRCQDVADHHAPLRIADDCCPQRRVIDDPSAVKVTEKVLHLPDRNRVPDTNVDPAPLFERSPADDSQQITVGVVQRASGVAGVDRRIGLQAVSVFEQGT